MKGQKQLLSLPLNREYSSAESQQTDYADNPNVYSNSWGYILSVVGFCVGFGAFLRFPYLVYKNGGGVFLIPYVLAITVIGMPLLYLQTAIGQMHRVSIPFVFKRIHPSLKILGLGIMTATFHFSTSYNILLTYSYRFMFTSFTYPLPFANQSITDNRYFQEQVLHQTQSINDFQAIDPTLLIIYLLSMALCHFLMKNGAKTSTKIIAVTASTPFFIFFILVIRGLFLSGAYEGIAYLFKPKWERLLDYNIWIDATTQAFFQVSLGYGAITNLSTAKPRRQDLIKSIIMVPLSLILIGLLCALTIFIYLSHFCLESGYQIDDPRLQLSGLQLSFNVIPKALLLLPMPNFWIFIFFFAMVLLAIDSQFGLLEAIYCYVRDEFQGREVIICGIKIDVQRAKHITAVFMCVGAPVLCSHAGIYWLSFFDYFMSNIPFSAWVILELYFFVYVFPWSETTAAIKRYTKIPTPAIITYCLTSYWLPTLLIANLLFSFYSQLFVFQRYTLGYALFGWFFSLYPMIVIWWKLFKLKEWPGFDNLKVSFKQLEHG